jgi:hypothetical protein
VEQSESQPWAEGVEAGSYPNCFETDTEPNTDADDGSRRNDCFKENNEPVVISQTASAAVEQSAWQVGAEGVEGGSNCFETDTEPHGEADNGTCTDEECVRASEVKDSLLPEQELEFGPTKISFALTLHLDGVGNHLYGLEKGSSAQIFFAVVNESNLGLRIVRYQFYETECGDNVFVGFIHVDASSRIMVSLLFLTEGKPLERYDVKGT